MKDETKLKKIQDRLDILLRDNTKPSGWYMSKEELIEEILIATGHLFSAEVEYPDEFSEDKQRATDWIDEARSKATEDENHLRVQEEENK